MCNAETISFGGRLDENKEIDFKVQFDIVQEYITKYKASLQEMKLFQDRPIPQQKNNSGDDMLDKQLTAQRGIIEELSRRDIKLPEETTSSEQLTLRWGGKKKRMTKIANNKKIDKETAFKKRTPPSSSSELEDSNLRDVKKGAFRRINTKNFSKGTLIGLSQKSPNNRVTIKPKQKTSDPSIINSPENAQLEVKNVDSIKKFTSLDNVVVKENLFIANMEIPYTQEPFDFYNESLSIDFLQARFLPDNTNLVKIFAYILEDRGNSKVFDFESMNRMEGEIFNPYFLDSFKIEEITPSDDTYLFIIYGTFEDVLKGEDVDFGSLIFGFSLVRLFEAKLNAKVNSLLPCIGLWCSGRKSPTSNIPCRLSKAPKTRRNKVS